MSILVLAALVSLPLTPAAAGEQWMEYVSKEGKYKVLMPGTPQEQRQAVKTSAGVIYVVLAGVERKGDGNYLVGFSKFSDATLKTDTEEKRLNNARDGAVASAKGKLAQEKQIKLDGHNGRELLIEVDAKTAVRMRMFVVKDHLYQIMAVGTRDLIAAPDTAKFLDSFKLVK